MSNTAWKKLRSRRVRGLTVPKTVPAGRVLMHNHVWPGPNCPCGVNGFRCWTADKPFKNFVLCPCGYAGLKHYAAKDHVAAWRDPKRRKRMERSMNAQARRQLHRLGLTAGDIAMLRRQCQKQRPA